MPDLEGIPRDLLFSIKRASAFLDEGAMGEIPKELLAAAPDGSPANRWLKLAAMSTIMCASKNSFEDLCLMPSLLNEVDQDVSAAFVKYLADRPGWLGPKKHAQRSNPAAARLCKRTAAVASVGKRTSSPASKSVYSMKSLRAKPLIHHRAAPVIAKPAEGSAEDEETQWPETETVSLNLLDDGASGWEEGQRFEFDDNEDKTHSDETLAPLH